MVTDNLLLHAVDCLTAKMGGTIRGSGGPGIAAIFGPGGPIILLQKVRGGGVFEGGPSTA